MSYVANQYNYATPLSSVAGLINETSNVEDIKYFTLSDNTLDGSYFPISDDVGIWSAAASDANGTLAEPFVVTVTENIIMNAFSLMGSRYCYPVAFTVNIYNGNTLLYTITETDNDSVEYFYPLPRTLNVTSYVVSITKVSAANSAARLYNMHYPGYVRRVDTLHANCTESSDVSFGIYLSKTDTLSMSALELTAGGAAVASVIYASDTLRTKETSKSIGHVGVVANDNLLIRENSKHYVKNTIDTVSDVVRVKYSSKLHILNTIDVARDTASQKLVEDITHVTNIFDTIHETVKVQSVDTPTLTNVHTKMKDPSRMVYGKVYITYTDPMLENETNVETNMSAYNSDKDQVIDGVTYNTERLFTLYDNDLSGNYSVMAEYKQVGWVSGTVSDATGAFTEAPYVKINFTTRPIVPLTLYFDDSHGCTAENFTVTFIHADGSHTVKTFVDNNDYQVLINEEVVLDVVSLVVAVTKVTKPHYPAAILEVPVLSTILYKGYENESDLVSIDMLEELTYEDDIEALGGVSANEVTVVIDNSDSMFYFNNNASAVSKRLRRNRRIEPWLGTEIVPGEIEWYKLGTYWSYRWNVPVNGLTATVVGFDTLGLLDTTSFENHVVLTDKSLGELIDYVLEDAKTALGFLKWKIDSALYDVKIPYAWFDAASHTAALRKISQAYPMHIYCDRDGLICAAPQKLQLDYYYDTWSDSTNVIEKEYDSLYTTLPNIVNVTVCIPQLVSGENLVRDNLVFDVSSTSTRTLNFSNPYVSDIVVNVDADDTVSYTYTAYSWGIVLNFTGTGLVRGITCTGTFVDTSNTSVLSRKDNESIRTNGAVTRDISADFIQTSELGNYIIERIFALSADDKYDATVRYRGDIALSINDPILLLNGIAPDNRYNIRRHQLTWNGALTGSADLNT